MECDCPKCKSVHPALTWCEAIPGLVLTILVLAAFVAGCWGAMLLWEMRG